MTEKSSPTSPAQSNKLRKKFDRKCWPHHPHEADPGREAMASTVAYELAQGWHGSFQALDCYCFMCVCVCARLCVHGCAHASGGKGTTLAIPPLTLTIFILCIWVRVSR